MQCRLIIQPCKIILLIMHIARFEQHSLSIQTASHSLNCLFFPGSFRDSLSQDWYVISIVYLCDGDFQSLLSFTVSPHVSCFTVCVFSLCVCFGTGKMCLVSLNDDNTMKICSKPFFFILLGCVSSFINRCPQALRAT